MTKMMIEELDNRLRRVIKEKRSSSRIGTIGKKGKVEEKKKEKGKGTNQEYLEWRMK